MSALQHAIAAARLGLPVFPLRAGTKDGHLSKSWKADATADLISVYETFHGRALNVGVVTNGLVVLDVDAGRGGLEALQLLGELPRTFAVRTPRGGLHIYFKSDSDYACSVWDAKRLKGFAPGIDVRAAGGYVLAPGSSFDGKPYTIECDAPVAALPDCLKARLRLYGCKDLDARETLCALDTAEALGAAERYLKSVAGATAEGSRNDQCFKHAARVQDFGVSPEACLGLMLDHWRFEGDFSAEEIETTVWSAARNRRAPIGRDNPLLGFSPVAVPAPIDAFASEVWTPTGEEIFDEIPRTPWIVENKILREAVTLLGAPGSAGKSLWTLQIAVGIATNDGSLFGGDVKERCNVLVINNEDPRDETLRRLAAVSNTFRKPFADIKQRVFFYSGQRLKFKALQRGVKGTGLAHTPALASLRSYIAKHGIGVVILDPLVSLHPAVENDNQQMQEVLEAFTSLASETRTAIVLVHHTAKPNAASSDSYAGNPNSIRGASAVKDAARIALTMFAMSPKDGEEYGVPAHLRHRYVRLDDAKLNFGLASPHAQWFRKASVDLGNGEQRGVLIPEALQSKTGGEASATISILAAELRERGRMTMTAAAEILAADSLFSDASRTTLARRIKAAFSSGPVEIPGGSVRLVTDGGLGGELIFEATF